VKKAEPSDREERDCHCNCEFGERGERSQTVLAGRFGVFRADDGLSVCPPGGGWDWSFGCFWPASNFLFRWAGGK